jgi:ABC-type sugar transport system permease subunit
MSQARVKATSPFTKKGEVAPPRKKLKVPRLFIFLCLSPWLFGIIFFTAYPMVSSFYQSFTKFNLIETPQWVGLENKKPNYADIIASVMKITIVAAQFSEIITMMNENP